MSLLQSLFSIFQGNSGKFAKLIMSSLKYTGAVDLTQYFVKNYSFSDIDEGVHVDFIFSRRLLNQILTVFMPTVIHITIDQVYFSLPNM